MEIIQQIKLRAVTANDNAIFFKVNVNGEDRIFIGQQNDKFDIQIDNNLPSVLDSDKLSSDMKLAESFQKAYIVDKKNINKDNIKKDVIIPCAVSKEIVQLGNSLYTLSKETNNNVLYLLYKKRLLNRYEDDKSHMIYYDLDISKFKSEYDAIYPNGVLRGDENYPGLINNFNKDINRFESTGKDQEEISVIDSLNDEKELLTIVYEALENSKDGTANYKNMDGYLEYLEDFKNVENRPDEMPFNLIYEYGEERQFENEQSITFADFIHLKNSLSPFFNVEVTNEQKFKLWRKYIKINNLNYQLWTSYSLETPKTISYLNNPNVYPLYCGNMIKNTLNYSNSVSDFLAKTTNVNSFAYKDLNSQGFTIHVDCPTKELANRYIFSYNNRAAAIKNSGDNHALQTPKQFAQWLIDNSNGLFHWKLGQLSKIKYPKSVHFSVDVVIDNNLFDTYLEIECVKDHNSSKIEIVENLLHSIPPCANILNIGYDSGQIYSKDSIEFRNFKNDQYVKKNINYYGVIDNVYDWTKIITDYQITDFYNKDGFKLTYETNDVECFDHKTTSDNQSTTAVNSKEWTIKKAWYAELIDAPEQWLCLQRALDIDHPDYVVLKDDSGEFKLTKEECDKLFRFTDEPYPKMKDIMAESDINENGINDIYEIDKDLTVSADEFNEFPTARKIKYILYKLLFNFFELPIESPKAPPPVHFSKKDKYGNEIGIKNYHLCRKSGVTIGSITCALYYFLKKEQLWKVGTKVRYKNFRLLPYESNAKATDIVNDHTKFFKNEISILDSQAIKFYYSPFDIRYALNSTTDKKADPPLDSYNSDISLIDLFGITIGGKFVDSHEILESNLISTLNKLDYTDSIINVDLSVSLKDDYQNDMLIIKTYVNGQLVNKYTYDKDSEKYNFIKNNIQSTDNIRFWVYAESLKNSNNNIIVSEFKYNNISMWNYPLSFGQIQLLRRLTISKDSITNYLNDNYYVSKYDFIKSDNYTNTDKLYGKIFSVDKYIKSVKYLFDTDTNETDSVSEDDKKLYKIQDFEFIDKINGINKLMPSSNRKSNLYSVKLENTGLVIEPTDDEDTKHFKKTISTALSSAINTICSKSEPLNTKLFSIIFDS